MGIEGNISRNTPQQEKFSLSEMPLVESNRLQTELACYVYDQDHEGEDIENVSEGSKMLDWIQKGYAKVFGDLEEFEFDDIESLADKIREGVTFH